MYSELDFVFLAKSIRDVHLQGLVREVYGVGVDCLKERTVPVTDTAAPTCHRNATTKRGRRGAQRIITIMRVIKQETEEEAILSDKTERKRNVNTFLGGTLFKMSVVSHIPSCNIFRVLESAKRIRRGSRLCGRFAPIEHVRRADRRPPIDNRFHLPSWRRLASSS